uniref:Putative secreted protein n=1 Tax=Lutzomyia longipalpis TaxID=7200 RepID=A0A7G3AM80_LUTLO
MFILDEFRTWFTMILLMSQVSVQHAKTNGRYSHEEAQSLPQLPSTRVLSSNSRWSLDSLTSGRCRECPAEAVRKDLRHNFQSFSAQLPFFSDTKL